MAGCHAAPTTSLSSHPITITNSAALKPDTTTKTVIIKKSPAGEPLEYAMDVRSVYCLDDECEIITVHLFWDPLGEYERYEIPAGKNLTKNEHVRFSRADHRALHTLLQDSQSLVQYVQPDELLKAEKETADDHPEQFAWRNPEYALDRADALSIPTPVDLQALVVPGAAYTSLTLWHWAHGEVPQHIRRITRDSASRRQLLQWLADENPHHVRFALDALAQRRLFDDAAITAVLNRCKQRDGDWVPHAWPFLTGATPHGPDRLAVYTTLLAEGTGPQRVFLLEKLAEEKEIPPQWFEALASCLNQFDSYYEIHLFLNLLSQHKVATPQVIQAVIALLDRPNSFITRRVYTFLSEQPATPELTHALTEYRTNQKEVRSTN